MITTLTTGSERSEAMQSQLRDELLRRLHRCASAAHIGVAFESPQRPREWLVPCFRGPCTVPPDISLMACTNSAVHRIVRLHPDEQTGSHLILCAKDEASTAFFNLIQELAKCVNEMDETSSREDLLLQELASSWETLAALYESSLDLQSSDNLQTVIDRLLDRSVVAGSDVAAILWILENGTFRVAAERRCHTSEVRTGSTGLMGEARKRAAPMVLDGNSDERLNAHIEPELREAGPIVMIPVHTRKGLEALLQVWRSPGSPAFESPAVRLLEAIALMAANAIENERLHRAALEGERMRQEMEIGASIQQHLLLGEHPQGISGVQIANYMLPSLEVGGDFYQFVRHSDTCFDAIVGDVMGKGVGAALMGAATKSNLLRVIAESRGSCDTNRLLQPEEIVTATNQYMSDQLMQLNSFVTLFYARFDLLAHTLTYVDAGHTQPLHYIRQSQSINLLYGEAFPLGFTANETYRQSVVRFEPEDIVLIYSDGMSEASNAAGQMFGADRIRLFLDKNALRCGSEIANGISDEVIIFRGSRELEDDLTCLVIKMNGENKGLPACRVQIVADTEELEKLRDWLASSLQTVFPGTISDDVLFNIQLAVQEAATNIIFHGIQPGSSNEIAIKILSDGSTVHIELDYEGVPFTPDDIPPPAFDGSRDHGFGLFLIKQLMDEVMYTYSCGRNTIALTKKIS